MAAERAANKAAYDRECAESAAAAAERDRLHKEARRQPQSAKPAPTAKPAPRPSAVSASLRGPKMAQQLEPTLAVSFYDYPVGTAAT